MHGAKSMCMTNTNNRAPKLTVTGRPEFIVARPGVRRDGSVAAPVFVLARPGLVPGSDLEAALEAIEAQLIGGAS